MVALAEVIIYQVRVTVVLHRREEGGDRMVAMVVVIIYRVRLSMVLHGGAG